MYEYVCEDCETVLRPEETTDTNPYEPAEPMPTGGIVAWSGTMEVTDMAAGKAKNGKVAVDVTMADGGIVRYVLDSDQLDKTIGLLEAVRDAE